MQDFESYVKSNWNIPNAASCGITYTHTSRVVIDKTSKVPVKNHSINLCIEWFDKDNNKLQTEKLSFLNDDMTKTYDKKMFTINRTELVNRFRAAKVQIVNRIISEKNDKLTKLQQEIAELQAYKGRTDDVIPQPMKEHIEVVQRSHQTTASTSPKQAFDM